MEDIYEDLLASNFIKLPFSSLLIDKAIKESIIDSNVLVFTNSIYTIKLCTQKDIIFKSNKLCAVLINHLNFKNDMRLTDFFEKNHGFNPLKTKISFYFIPGIKKISYEILFLSR